MIKGLGKVVEGILSICSEYSNEYEAKIKVSGDKTAIGISISGPKSMLLHVRGGTY